MHYMTLIREQLTLVFVLDDVIEGLEEQADVHVVRGGRVEESRRGEQMEQTDQLDRRHLQSRERGEGVMEVEWKRG